ncbi:MAG: peptidase [Candidatus Accumulibacter sp.]|jgi:hypothetical protein|nr:peptidase [Accumulibacter sp.]
MDSIKRLHIFKPGRQIANGGAALDFSAADLEACARSYDPALHEAPIVVGHPSTDSPAYGWVAALAATGDGLEATPHQVDPAFAELVGLGRYKKISASFYLPDSPANPKPGAYYLRHVGFLGATPPAVKGLRSPQFAENEKGVVEFSDWGGETNAGLWRRLREWLLVKFGQEAADQVAPDWQIETLREAANRKADDLAQNTEFFAAAEPPETANVATSQHLPPFINPSKETNTVTPEQAAAIEAENARLKQQLADFSEAQAKAARAALHAEHAALAERLIGEGRLTPKHKEAVVAFLDFAGSTSAVEFGEGAALAVPIEASFKAFLADLPKVIEFGEVATKDKAVGGPSAAAVAEFAEKPVDPERLALHGRACALAAEKGIAYDAAVRQLIIQGDRNA